MKHRAGLDRSQTLLFPERLEDYLAPENPVRFLDAFVGSLDLHALKFGKARCAATGCPPYDPAVLLKLYLYGYLHRVRSSRLLEAECHRNVEVIWLTGKQAPDFKTIADFRKDNLKPLQAVARQFTLLCRKLELFGGELLAIDGSQFAAVNARDQNFNAAKLQDLIARADARLAEYFAQLDAAAAAAPGAAAPSKSELEQKIAALQERQEWHKELLGQLDAEQKQISVTDPDTRKMPTAHGTVVGYNAQLAVDAKAQADRRRRRDQRRDRLQPTGRRGAGSQDESGRQTSRSAGRRRLLPRGRSEPVRGAWPDALHSQGRHQREHGAGTVWQKPVQV
jgi:transposase